MNQTYYAVDVLGNVHEFYCRGARDAYLARTPDAEPAQWKKQNWHILKDYLRRKNNMLEIKGKPVEMQDYDANGSAVYCGKCNRRIYRYRWNGEDWTYKHFRTRVQHEPAQFTWSENGHDHNPRSG